MNLFSVKNVIGFLIAVTLLSGIVVGVRLVQQQTQFKSRATGSCGDNPVTPPSGYLWKALCSNPVCRDNSDCPRGADNQEGWCYGFDDGSKCLQLQYIGGGGGGSSCRDNPVTPPSGYLWKALCSNPVCRDNSDCPRGADNQEGWCYGFDDGSKCLQLQYIGGGGDPTPTPTQAPPSETGSINIPSSFTSSGSSWNITGSFSTSRGGILYYQNGPPCSSVNDCFSKYGYNNWAEIKRTTSAGATQFSWNPTLGDVPPGAHTFGLFNADGSRLIAVANSNFILSSITPTRPPGTTPTQAPPSETGSINIPSSFTSSGSSWNITGSFSTSRGGILYYQNGPPCSSVNDCFSKYGYNNWAEIKRTTSAGATQFSWNPTLGDVPPGAHTFGLFNADGSRLIAVANSNFILSGTTPTGGPIVPEGSVCSYDILDSDGKSVKAGPIYENEKYSFRITMINTVKEGRAEDWVRGIHTLQALENTSTVWGIPSSYPLPRERVPHCTGNCTGIRFDDIDFTAKPLPAGKKFEDRRIFFQMVGPSGPFGAACEPQNIRVTKKVEVTTTRCFVVSENPNEVIAVRDSASPCDSNLNPSVKAYTADNMITPFLLNQTPGKKDIYVMFFDNNNRPSNSGTPIVKTVFYSPNPKITDIDCSFDTGSGQSTIYTIRGSGFGNPVLGSKVLIGDQEANIGQDGWTQNTIVARMDQRIESKTNVSVVLSDGRKVTESCTVGTVTASLSVKNLCTPGGLFDASDLEVQVYLNGPEPFTKQTVKTDKEGKAQGFAPKLEKNKIYTAIIKGPGTLSRKRIFSTTSAATVIGPIVLPPGDIAPSPVTDDVINVNDYNAMFSQWSPVKDVTRVADLNKDNRVNTIDVACLRINFNDRGDIFTPITPAPTASPSATPTSTPSATLAPTGTLTPTTPPSTPTPAVSPTSTLTPTPNLTPTPTWVPGGEN